MNIVEKKSFYRLDIHNLQTKALSFPDHEKTIKEVVFIVL